MYQSCAAGGCQTGSFEDRIERRVVLHLQVHWLHADDRERGTYRHEKKVNMNATACCWYPCTTVFPVGEGHVRVQLCQRLSALCTRWDGERWCVGCIPSERSGAYGSLTGREIDRSLVVRRGRSSSSLSLLRFDASWFITSLSLPLRWGISPTPCSRYRRGLLERS